MPEATSATITIHADAETHEVTVSGILGEDGSQHKSHTLKTKRASIAVTELIGRILAVTAADEAVGEIADNLGLDLVNLPL